MTFTGNNFPQDTNQFSKGRSFTSFATTREAIYSTEDKERSSELFLESQALTAWETELNAMRLH